MTCQGAIQILEIKRHDTLPKPKGVLTENNPDDPANPTPVDLTGATIKFIMILESDLTVKVNGVATLTDGPAGEFEYDWVAINTNTSGDYLGEWEITFPSGGKLSVPADNSFKIRIRDDFDNA